MHPSIDFPSSFTALCVFKSAVSVRLLSRELSQEVHLMLIQPDTATAPQWTEHDGQRGPGEVHGASGHPANTQYHVAKIQQCHTVGALLQAQLATSGGGSLLLLYHPYLLLCLHPRDLIVCTFSL